MNDTLTAQNSIAADPFDDPLCDPRPREHDANGGAAEFRVYLSDSDVQYVLKAEVPGASADDFAISVIGYEVSITRKGKNGAAAGPTGSARRSVWLDCRVDAARVVSYQDGVLELSLPKTSVDAARLITAGSSGGLRER